MSGKDRLVAMAAMVCLVIQGCAGPKPSRPLAPTESLPSEASEGVPPAWIETSRQSTWLAYWNYCWAARCVDWDSPQRRDDVPFIATAIGETVTFHLDEGLSETDVYLQFFDGERLTPRQQIGTGETVQWRVSRDGYFLLSLDPGEGDLSYTARLLVDE